MTARNPKARRARCGMYHAEIRDLATDTHKHCAGCGVFKALEEFSVQKHGLKGRQSECVGCRRDYLREHRNRPEQKEKARARWKTDRWSQLQRAAYVRRTYGEAGVQVEARRLAGDPCDICGGGPGGGHMSIDHCHKTGRVRGLLCGPCNTTLGRLNESTETLTKMIAYLEAHVDTSSEDKEQVS